MAQVSKSERVRRYMAKHPEVESPVEIATALEKYQVSPAVVSSVKMSMKNGHANGVIETDRVDWRRVQHCLSIARDLIAATGSIAEAKDCLDATT